jgi:threonine/homoserine/homoserine lactone efflux protein
MCSISVLAVMTVAGAGYLIWLGVGMLRHPASVRAQPEEAAGSTWRQAIKGFAISGLNPKVFLLFLALLPQFVVATATWSVAAQILVLGLVHVANCAVVYTGVGVGARSVLRARRAAAQWVSRISGVAMIIIGAVLISEQVLAHTAH